MPTVEQNKTNWDTEYDWEHEGEKWSAEWGGSEAQWFGTILPRIRSFVPTGTLLEIGPGHGRWTHYLRNYCERLVAVDLSEKGIASCQKRFSGSNIAFHVNDGSSLAMISDESVDFAFSFDSLVHAEMDSLASYLEQLARKLKPDGVGFFHHSNMGCYVDRSLGKLPASIDNRHWRAASVTAAAVAETCEKVGLRCIGQEIVNWLGDALNDCFSVFTRKGSRFVREYRVIQNPDFMKEVNHIRFLAHHYTFGTSRFVEHFERKARFERTRDNLIRLSGAYFQVGRYADCIAVCEESLKIQPSDPAAYNNICTASNMLGLFAEGKLAGEKAVDLAPSALLYRNNLNVSIAGLAKLQQLHHENPPK